MEITMYPSAAVIAAAADRDDPLMAVIAFDGETLESSVFSYFSYFSYKT